MRRIMRVLIGSGIVISLVSPAQVFGQERVALSEGELLKPEIQKLQERLEKLESAQRSGSTAAVAQATQRQGEREIQTERGSLFEAAGLPKPEVGGVRISGFVVGSFNYNSHLQMVPEFAGGTPALADPKATNFRFDKFGFSVAKTFASWLSASAAIEVESHRDRHSHGFAPAFGCNGGGACREQFGAEEAETETNLDKFNVTAIAPIGNGLALSIGRFDVPFGIERHDESLNLTATASEVFSFGRPNTVTGLQAAYQLNPMVDAAFFVVNRWESHITHDDFNDNNEGKTVGGRIGFTPSVGVGLVNFGIGGFYGPEQDDNNSHNRWVVDLDATWSPATLPLLLAGELVLGGESKVEARKVGEPVAGEAIEGDVKWWGFYLIGHYDFNPWLGLTLRYGYFDDQDGARTGVTQKLQSITVAPIVHLSRLIPDLRPTGATYARTRHPIDWVNLKIEYRYNRSDRPVFSDEKPAVPIFDSQKYSHQLQLQVVVNF